MKTRGGDGFSRVRDASAKGQKRHKRQQKQKRKRKRKHHKSSTTQQLPRIAIPALDTHAVPEQHRYDDATTITGEEKRHVLCGSSSHSLSDVVALKGSIGENLNGWSECCYGMLSDIYVRLRHPSSISISKPQLPPNLPVTFREPNILSTLENNSIEFEIPSATHSRILSKLNGLEDVTLQTNCRSRLELPPQSSSQALKRRNGKASRTWRLNVIIYGIRVLEDVIGQYLSKHRIYLQDPIDCERNVLYRNPHMISKGGNIIMTDYFKAPPATIEIERLSVGPNLLAQLMAEQKPLPATEPPATVTRHLFCHQKQALTFMVQREQGWDLNNSQDIWTVQESQPGLYRYRNNVSGCYQTDPPPCFRGGLLADDMGLGKTLSMISLIATNQFLQSSPSSCSGHDDTPLPKLKSTLLIVPPPRLFWISTDGSAVIQAWEKQFSMHIQPDTFHIHVYHGQNRKGIGYLQQCDVVITTFQTLSSVWRKKNLQDIQDPIFSVIWHRVILDEAHTIQNAQSQLAQACCALQAERRWAITGTPIQNKLTDFASILKFLRAYPYCDQKVFDEEISRPWHQVDQDGFLRLKSLVRAITISRTKTVINLPARIDEIHYLEFSEGERDAYNAAKKDTIALFEEAISSGRQGGKTFNALTRLNFLRLFCNLGLLVNGRSTSETLPTFRDCGYSPSQRVDDDSFYADVLDGSATCFQCGQALLEDLLEGVSTPNFNHSPSISSAPNVCDNCRSAPTYRQPDLMPPFHHEQSDVFTASSLPSTPSDGTQVISPIELMPTKIKALIADLSKHCSAEKCAVFSFWTSTLDLVQQMLDENEMIYTRIDGKTSLPKRSESMCSFQTNDTVRVILVSITCGGAGLDLTAASRAYLLEPHWNPMTEEQALCRVHRVGQEREVTTIRYLMRDSFEEQVVEIQKRKKKLAEVTFGSGQLSEDGIGVNTLLYLKSVLE